MPKTIRELIDDARASGDWNAVADWCEAYDWPESDRIPIGEFSLWQAVRTEGHTEDRVCEAVTEARAGGATWDRIGRILNVTGQTARERYGKRIDEAEAIAAGPVTDLLL